MTKPFPCCCGCQYCPQYGVGDVWTYLLAGMTIGSGSFVSSSTGNPLHTDLNALGATNFTFPSVTMGGAVKQAYSGALSPFPGATWSYSSGVNVSSLTLEVYVNDHCSKVWLAGFTIRATSGLGSGIIGQFGADTEPGSPNCGSNLTSIQTTAPSSWVLGVTGNVTLDPP